MKTKHLTALAALAGSAFLTQAAMAVTTYTDGDLLLGFHTANAPGNSSEIVVNLGSFSAFTTNISNVIGSLNSDLIATYGASWATRNDLFWGIMGVDDSATDVFASRGEATYGTQVAAWKNRTVSITQNGVSAIESAGAGYSNLLPGSNASAAIESNASSTNNHWTLFAPQIASGLLSGNGIDMAPVGSSALDLFRLDGNGTAVNQNAAYVGTFTIAGSGATVGNVSFSLAPPVTVPEPGRAVLLGFGLASALLRRRRA
jgi:hypothetical protein